LDGVFESAKTGSHRHPESDDRQERVPSHEDEPQYILMREMYTNALVCEGAAERLRSLMSPTKEDGGMEDLFDEEIYASYIIAREGARRTQNKIRSMPLYEKCRRGGNDIAQCAETDVKTMGGTPDDISARAQSWEHLKSFGQ
jgi:hypothetical protein